MLLTVPEFLDSLLAVGLLTGPELAAWEAKTVRDPEELARELVRDRKLTKYQAAAVYQGKADTLVLGNYLILDRLGAGGMGQVFRARHRRMDRIVALKVLSKKALASSDAVARFQREVRAAAKLVHPHIVTAYDADEAGGTHFLVMEYVDGSDLASFVKQNGPMSVDRAIDCVMQAARGLQKAHAEGITHRDIKPANLLLDRDGNVKILDMGLARLGDPLADPEAAQAPELTHSGSIMGTIDYMAPEQAMDCRQADARSDIYSLGCTFHYLLTGRAPYAGDTVMKRLTSHQQAEIPSLAARRNDVSPAVQEVFARMVAKRPSDRYSSAAELLGALERLGDPSADAPPRVVNAAATVTTSSSNVPHESSPHKRSRRMSFVVSALLLAIVVGGGGWWLSTAQKAPRMATAPAPSPSEKLAAVNKVPTSEPAPVAANEAKTIPGAAGKPPLPASSEKPPGTSATIPSPSVAPEAKLPAIESAPNLPQTEKGPPPASVPLKQPSEADAPATKPTVMLADAGAGAAGAPQSSAITDKLPVPDVESQRKAFQLLQDVFKDDYAAARQPDGKAALAEKLLRESGVTKDDAAAMYVLGREARDLAVEAGNPDLAERAIVVLAKRFKMDRLAELTIALEKMSARPHPLKSNRAIAEAALALVDEAETAGDFDAAKRLADSATASARKVRDPELSKRTIEMAKGVATVKQLWDDWQKARATLARTPSDEAANLAAGRYLCFVKGDWDEGFAHLAKGSDGVLKQLAIQGAKAAKTPDAFVELGDASFEAAESAKGRDKVELQMIAANWYLQAEPEVTGLLKSKVEKRLAELDDKTASVRQKSIGRMPRMMNLALAPGVNMRFRLIPSGTFLMGRPGSTGDYLSHSVTLTQPFYIGLTEVTQAQWLAVMGRMPKQAKDEPEWAVGGISWKDCQEYVDRLNASPLGRKLHFHLPTEAEWEYACRAGSTGEYCFGDNADQLSNYGWFKDNAGGTQHPVAQLKPNEWGLFDMHGSGWEWCSDWYAADYYKHSPNTDPTGPATGDKRVMRGGSWTSAREGCSSTHRNSGLPETMGSNFALRVACEPLVAQ